MGIELDKDLAATLTDEELAAISESEHSADDLEAIKHIAGEDADDSDDDENEVPNGGAPVEGKDADDQDEGDQGDKLAANDEEAPNEFRQQQFKADVPADLEEQIATVATEKKALAQQFRDGEIDLDEFNTKSEELDTKRDDLNKIKFKAEVFEDMNAQTGQQAWANTVNSFVTNVAKSEGIDYRKDPEKAGDLDLFVKRLAENKANEGKPMNWFLQEAHKRVKALHGVTETQAKSDKVETDADKLKAARENRKPPIDAAPKTLSQVPGGDGPGDVSGEFSDVEGLEGLELEDAIARMTPSQRERYLKAA